MSAFAAPVRELMRAARRPSWPVQSDTGKLTRRRPTGTSTPLGRNDVNSPSPWSSYLILSPAGPSPKGMSTKATAKSPRLASTQHVLEINPFEESFSSLPVVKTPVRSAVEASMPVARRMSSRKRNPTANAQELDRLAMRDAKRPKLRLGLEDSSTSATTDSTASSFASRSTSISSKATTVSPASSVAPSPEMATKVDQSKGLLGQLASSVEAAAGPAPFHYQPAPLPINLNPHGHNVPQQSFYPATMAPGSSTFAAFAPDNLSFDGSMTYDPFAALPPASINPVALPQLPIPPPLDLPAAVSEAPVYAPKKRGRKPKGAPVVVDTEADRAAALERNRIAASKSRQRKKERVGNLEMSTFESRGVSSARG